SSWRATPRSRAGRCRGCAACRSACRRCRTRTSSSWKPGSPRVARAEIDYDRRMSLVDHYRAMARYNRWMNGKLYALAAGLSDADRTRDLGAFFGSIHGTLNHILLADRTWLGRFTGDRERFA